MRRSAYACILFCFFLAISCKEKKPDAVSPESLGPIDSATLPDPQQMPANNYAAVDVSPMDMSYFPVDYPKLKMASKNAPPAVMRVIYSRPHLGKRRLFPDILKHNEIWRLGANEATEIEFYKSVSIADQKIAAGRYVMYCIPQPGKWTIVFNSNKDTWGLKPDSTMDAARVDVPITTGNPPLEYFTLVFEKTEKSADLVIGWDDVLARLPIGY